MDSDQSDYEAMITPFECVHDDGYRHGKLPSKPRHLALLHRWIILVGCMISEEGLAHATEQARAITEKGGDGYEFAPDPDSQVDVKYSCWDCGIEWSTYQACKELVEKDPAYKARLVMWRSTHGKGSDVAIPCHPQVKRICDQIMEMDDEVIQESMQRRFARWGN